MIKNAEYVEGFGNVHLDSHIHTGVPRHSVTLLLISFIFYLLSFMFYKVIQTHTMDFFAPNSIFTPAGDMHVEVACSKLSKLLKTMYYSVSEPTLNRKGCITINVFSGRMWYQRTSLSECVSLESICERQERGGKQGQIVRWMKVKWKNVHIYLGSRSYPWDALSK